MSREDDVFVPCAGKNGTAATCAVSRQKCLCQTEQYKSVAKFLAVQRERDMKDTLKGFRKNALSLSLLWKNVFPVVSLQVCFVLQLLFVCALLTPCRFYLPLSFVHLCLCASGGCSGQFNDSFDLNY